MLLWAHQFNIAVSECRANIKGATQNFLRYDINHHSCVYSKCTRAHLPQLMESTLRPQCKYYLAPTPVCPSDEATAVSEPSSAPRSSRACSSAPPCALSPVKHNFVREGNKQWRWMVVCLACEPAHHLCEVVFFSQNALPRRHQLIKLIKLFLDLHVQLCGEWASAIFPQMQGGI